MKRRILTPEALLFILVLLGGCEGDEDTEQPNQSPQSVQEKVEVICADTTESESNCATFTEELLLTIENHNYLTTDYTKAHDIGGYPSVVSIGKNIAVYVDNEGAEDFLQVDPNVRGSNAEVPIGTKIIREVWDEASMNKYTAMIKMEAGYFPEGGDFSYIEIATDGSIISGGKNEVCGECHLVRDNDGFLFGVDSEYRVDLNQDGSGDTPEPTLPPETDPEPPETDPVPEEDFTDANNKMMILARQSIQAGNYVNSEDFIKVNNEAFPSALNGGVDYIEVYVSTFGYDEYIKANPDSDEPVDIDLPEDTVIIRSVANFEGELSKLTVMVKGPAGYYPDGGDFYYGEFETNSQVIEVDGIPSEGPLTQCGGCHDTLRKDMAYLFGVSPLFHALQNQ